MRTRILIFFILMSSFSVLLIGILSFRLSFDVIRDKANQFSRQMIDNVAEKSDELFTEALRTSQMVANDPNIQATLRKPLEPDLGKRYSKDLEVDTQLNFIQSYKSNILGIYVVGADGSKFKSSFYSLKSEDLRSEDWYGTVTSGSDPVWFSSHRGSFTVVTVGQSLLSVGLPIVDKASGKNLGAVLVDIEVEVLLRIISSKLGETGFTFMLDSRGEVISNLDNRLTQDETAALDRAAEAVRSSETGRLPSRGEGKYLFFSKTSPITGWTVIGAIPTEELSKDTLAIRRSITLLLFATCLLDLLAAWYFAGVVANPLKKLMLLMRRVEGGDFSVVMNVHTTDEIGRLGESFNIMVERIRDLMSKVYEEHQKLRSAELTALEAQINPHFLFNTLDTVIWLSRADRSQDVISMVTAITKLFRIGISRGMELITISDELEHVRSYLTIQEIRYQNKMEYLIEVPESLRSYRIPKIILQPIVENSIYHGIKNMRGKGSIAIRAEADGGDIVFRVMDTGMGMDPTALDSLRAALVAGASAEELTESYGLRNVNERLRLFFGPEYGLTVESVFGEGTVVFVRIPMREHAEDQGPARPGTAPHSPAPPRG